MNIYLHTEIFLREFDSKLLLAVFAASKGHSVVVGDKQSLLFGINNKYFHPGIFHTKSITPSAGKIARHNFLSDNGFLITSIDEEAGILDYGYESFALRRFSLESLKSASLVFTWGAEDFNFLVKKYPQHQHKFILSGSPRVDLWRPKLSNYWLNPSKTTDRSYLLVVSNMGIQERSIHHTLKLAKNNGYLDRDPDYFKERLLRYAENMRLTYEFIVAIKKISKELPDIDIVFRPHPNENIEAWEIMLDEIPRVQVIREGSVSAWVNQSFAVLHSSCTTALEAIVANKPVIAYLPFKQNFARDLPNDISLKVENLNDLINSISDIFHQHLDQSEKKLTPIKIEVSNKLFIDDAELAAEKIIKSWEVVNNGLLSVPGNLFKLKTHMRFIKFKRSLKGMLRDFLGFNYPKEMPNHKFPPLDECDVRLRVHRFQEVLGICVPLECKLLDDRMVQIKPKQSLNV